MPDHTTSTTMFDLLLALAQTLPTEVQAQALPTVTPVVRLELSRSRRRVFVFRDDKVVSSYPVAIGRPGWETPIGKWKIYAKLKDPGWTSFISGRKMPPGPDNPMGSRWIGYYQDARGEIGFHGTSNTKSVGKTVSAGCNRMYEGDVQKLYEEVSIGDEVKVVD